ncbi:MAG: hypothetical protein DRO88_13765 [Promethearchaeia archaeon]|nr:MAG: hypothetical protein DRO88_13765 [Candidatus Lokiarchaeia archaeon]
MSEETLKKHSFGILLSYVLSSFGTNILIGIVSSYGFYFYENFTSLTSILATVAYVIFIIWDGINDPLLGVFFDRPSKFTRKWGRRFPWIVLFIIPLCVFSWLSFSPPVGMTPGLVFMWMLFFLIGYEFFYTGITVNIGALFPYKFRRQKERQTLGFLGIFSVIIGMAVGQMVLPALVDIEDPTSFGKVVLLLSGVALLFMILGIPGIRESKEIIDMYLEGEEKSEKKNVFKTILSVMNDRNLWGYTAIVAATGIIQFSATMSMLYIVQYVLGKDFSFMMYFIMALVAGQILAIPTSMIILKKIGHYNLFKYSSLALILLPLLIFIGDILYLYIAIYFLAGFIVSHIVISTPLNQADMIDADVVRSGKRREGAYVGFVMLLNRLGPLIATLIIGITHSLTGYVEGAPTQSPEAILGIKLHFGLFPVIIGIIGYFLFNHLWKLRPETMEDIRNKLAEMKV